ncbi:MAG: ABC transporter permease [Runella slithyformis]|nr:MAG: ABC transporter permease [Runella sp.]TAG25334.1 MAG: ABC transporter permease [Cytophagales bacterium]TAG42552.1 MAG: ABC transporter permease [Cytophagia bacterium]TAG84707.1 MAG: ABC transporter permease [Cytophagales bacterium]TAH15344.1 MAG: ABC transporter permease [Runella slithyformis]
MLRSYFKIAWRNLLKNKTFSFINIFGLAVGLCCFLLISLYIVDELSYDRHFKNADRIYRINGDVRFGGSNLRMSQSPDPLGAVLKKDYPQVEQFVRLYTNYGSNYVKKGNELINEKQIAHADSTFFDVFSLPILDGNPKTALNAPNTAAISATAAIKYFGTTQAVGKTLEVGITPKTIYNITSVYADMPANSHFNFDFILSMDNVKYPFGNYLSHNFYTYIRLREGTDYKGFELKLTEVVDRYVLPQAKTFIDIKNRADFEKAGNKIEYSLIPITDIHLKSDRGELNPASNMQYIYIFGAVALFLLLIACINFMNLSTARSANRAKEVGIRKVLGTVRKTLMGQFIAESALTSYISMALALLMVGLLMPAFNELSAKSFSLTTLFSVQFLPFLLFLPLLVGILAGYYPAFFLSSYKPIEVLKTKLNTGFAKSNLRSVLVTFQFVVSLTLIITTVVVYQQLHYIQTKNVGFGKDQVLVINAAAALKDNREAFKNEVVQMAGVKSGSLSQYLPVANSSRSDNTLSKDAVMTQTNGLNMQSWKIDYDYISTLGMEIAKGRNFSKAFGSDSSAVIINETTAKMLGYDDPVGKNLYNHNGNPDGTSEALTIVGVVKNFHFESLRENIRPLCFRLQKSRNGLFFKINTTNTPQLISQIEAKWKKIAPEMPFTYSFLDQSFDGMYRAEQRIGKVALIFAFLTILIACLGLFGLVTYMTEQRTKEIGIRKVLGASVMSITTMLSKDFLKLVMVGIVIASPLAYFAMKNWLQDFAFRIEIEWWIFVVTGVIAIFVALLTVGYQAIKAALMNPVESLKTE